VFTLRFRGGANLYSFEQRLYEITNREKNGKEKELTMLAEKELEKDEDAPMTIATHPSRNEIVCGINSSTEKLEKGQNENCRVFKVENNESDFFLLVLIWTKTEL
jgi:hypothetical protein